MAIATPYVEKTDEQKAITEMVRQFADEQIIPNAEHYDHEDEFPEPIVEQMKELGLFGVTIPEEYGGMGLDLTTYAMIVEELSRGWISISGIVNTHFIGSYLLMKFGTEEQKQKYLPKMATGEMRAAFSLSEPELGSDVAAIKTSAKKLPDGDAYEINGTKMWVTNGLLSSLVFVLVRTDPTADPKHRGLTCFIAEKEPGVGKNTGEFEGFDVPPKIKKMGYKGVESTELVFDGYRCPAENILGGEEAGLNRGFPQMMDALELGRVNVAARGVGLAQRALELALKYSQERRAFGRPISQHQAIQFKLADMATQVEAARLLTHRAARMKDAGERSDIEAGMAKLFASETGRFCAEECLRIHGGYGYSKEYEIERIYRDAPLLLIGEGTSEIQRMVIGRKLLERHKIAIRSWALTGKLDGLGADSRADEIVATVNEDGNSSLYTVSPAGRHGGQVTHYTYLPAGPFGAGEAFAALDTVGSSSQTTELDTLDLQTGALSPLVTGFAGIKGIVWAPGRADEGGGGGGNGPRGHHHGHRRGGDHGRRRGTAG